MVKVELIDKTRNYKETIELKDKPYTVQRATNGLENTTLINIVYANPDPEADPDVNLILLYNKMQEIGIGNLSVKVYKGEVMVGELPTVMNYNYNINPTSHRNVSVLEETLTFVAFKENE